MDSSEEYYDEDEEVYQNYEQMGFQNDQMLQEMFNGDGDEDVHLNYLQILQNFEMEMNEPIQVQQQVMAIQPEESYDMIDFNRIQNLDKVGAFVDEIQCPICYNVLISPQHCKKCEKSFCQVCYDAWIRNSNHGKCPCCRERLNAISPAPKILINLLSKVKLYCQHKEQGCAQIFDYEQRIRHTNEECLYTLVKCANLECQTRVQRKDLNDHKQQCPFQQIICELCGDYVQRRQMENHLINECRFRIVTCQWCTSTMEFCYYIAHEPDCPCKYETCQYCKTKYTKDKFLAHTKVKCYKKQKNYYKHKYEQQQNQNSKLAKQLTDQSELIEILQRQINDLNFNQGLNTSRVRIISVQSMKEQQQ